MINRCSVGTAVVSRSGRECPSSEVGTSAIGQANGARSCPEAKKLARFNLTLMVPEGCYEYIRTNTPCEIVNC